MKKLYTLILFAIISTAVQAQFWYSPIITDSIDFELPSPYVLLDTSATNLWQIAPPTKPILNSPVSPTHVIITDSLQPYPINTNTYFDIVLSQENLGWFPAMMIVKFKHKICSDSVRDGGYITYSCDNGANWQNVIDNPPCSYWDYHPGDGEGEDYRNLYSNEDTLFNGEPGFSGCMDDWQEVILDWGFWPVQPPPGQDILDTVLIRFNFISDTINTPFDGWMIDDIQFIEASIPGSTNNPDKARFTIYPNPVTSVVNIELDKFYAGLNMKLINSVGKVVQQKSHSGGETLSLHLKRELPEGIYFLEIFNDNGSLGTRKLMIQH